MASQEPPAVPLGIGAEAWTVLKIVMGALAVLFAFTALYVTAFHSPRAKGFDVGVVGTPAQATRLQATLDREARGSFDVKRYGSERAARSALLGTHVHGVLVPGPPQNRLLVAQAFGSAPTQSLVEGLQQAVAPQGSPAIAVQDLRPLPSNDRRGLSSLFAVVGTLIPSLVFGGLLSVFGRALPWRLRWTAVLIYALAAGLVVAFNVDVLVGALPGHFAGIAVVSALLALAVSAVAHGLGHLLGPAGIVAAIITLLLLGLSSAGGAVTYEFEPGFYGAISQLLPPGDALTAIRNVQYFHWAATLAPLLVLGAWALGGLAFGLLGEQFGPHVRRARSAAPA